MVVAAMAVFASVSCEKVGFGGRGKTIIPNVVSGGSLKSPYTKGCVITDDSLKTFKIAAYAESEWHDNTVETGDPGSLSQPHPAGEYFGSTDVSRNGDKWEMATTYDWINDIKLSFWSWNASIAPDVDPDDEGRYNKARFSLTVAEQAKYEPDLLFAYNGEKRSFDEDGGIFASVGTRDDNYVNIHFYHALSAIRFDISEAVGSHTVDRIELSGIYTGGTCNIDASSGTPLFEWDGNATGTVFENYTTADFQADGKYLAGTAKEFMMIPQNLTASSEITVYFDGSSTGITRPLGTSVPWVAGKYYGYKIKYTGTVAEIILSSVIDIDSWLEEEEQNLEL